MAAMAEQLEAARGQVAEAVAAVDGMRTQLLQQTDAHTAELAAARGAAEAAMAQVVPYMCASPGLKTCRKSSERHAYKSMYP